MGSEHFPPPAEILKKANFCQSIQSWLALPSLGAGCVQRFASSGESCLEKHCRRGTGENESKALDRVFLSGRLPEGTMLLTIQS